MHTSNGMGEGKKSGGGEVSQPVRRDTVKAAQQRHDNDMQHALSGGHGRHGLSFTIGVQQTAISKCRLNLCRKVRCPARVPRSFFSWPLIFSTTSTGRFLPRSSLIFSPPFSPLAA